ncbi:MAG: hypothetical protein ACYC2P_13350 [Paludibacteraceae bacterium]
MQKLYGWALKSISRLSLASYFDNCSDLSLYLFVKVLTTGEHKWLIKSGNPTKEQLKEAWEQIFDEYSRLSENKQQNYLLNLLREYYSIPNKLTIIQTIVDNLALRYDPNLIALLRQMGFRHSYSPETFVNDLKLTVTQAKGLILKYKSLYEDLEKLQKQDNKVEPNDYDLILSELSKYQGYRLDPKTITVSEFCAIVKRFKLDNKK